MELISVLITSGEGYSSPNATCWQPVTSSGLASPTFDRPDACPSAHVQDSSRIIELGLTESPVLRHPEDLMQQFQSIQFVLDIGQVLCTIRGQVD